MKLSPRTYERWWDLHTWAGLLSSPFVYLIFFFGVLTLFHGEISVWQEARGPVPSLLEVDQILNSELERGSMAPASVRINFPRPRRPGFSISYTDEKGTDQFRVLEREGLRSVRSEVADFLYGMHYLQFPGAPGWLYTLAGLASAILLMVVVTGLLIHLPAIRREFHQFRPRKKLRVVWSDAHKVLGTMGLPFALVYAFTGVWMGLDSLVAPRVTAVSFAGDEAASTRAMNGEPGPDSTIEPANVRATRLSLAALVEHAQRAPVPAHSSRTSHDCRAVYLENIGDQNGIARFMCADYDLVFRQVDGSPVEPAAPVRPTLSARVATVPYELHFIEFGGMTLRVVYALLGVAACIAILSGNWLWIERRGKSRSTWLLQRATLAIGGGPLVASSAMMLVNRLQVSADLERLCFWSSWLLAALLSFGLRKARSGWSLLLAVSSVLLFSTAAFGLARELGDAGASPPTARVVDCVLFAIGLGLSLLGRALRGYGSSNDRSMELSHGT